MSSLQPTVTASAADVEAKSAVTDCKNDKISDLDANSATSSTPPKPVPRESTEFLTGRRIRDVSDEFFFPGRPDVTQTERKTWKLLLTSTEIQLCVRWVAAQINRKFKGQKIVLTGILKGVFIFMSDLCKHLTIPYTVNFLEASSYVGRKQSGQVTLTSGLQPKRFEGRKIVLLDELFDNGKTIHTLTQILMDHLNVPRSDIYTCTLFKKIKDIKYPAPDLTGFDQFPDLWLVGYGLDSNGTKRGWPHVYGVPKPAGFKRSDLDKILDHTAEGEELFTAVRCDFRAKLAQLAGSF